MTLKAAAVTADLAAVLAAVPERRDFSFSADLGCVAWIDGDVIEWVCDGAAGAAADSARRIDLGLALPPGTHIEHLGWGFGISRPTDAGAEILAVETGGAGGPGSRVRRVVSAATPRMCLLPRLPGAGWQLLAVARFDGTSVLWRIDWAEAAATEAGRLPGVVYGGVWLDAGHRMALNLVGSSGHSSVYTVDLDAGRYSLLFEASADSDDRAVLFDPGGARLVVTTDVFGYPGVGIAQLDGGGAVQFLPPLDEGEEAAAPVGFVDGARRLLLRHENGPHARLRLADLSTMRVGAPLPIPDGEVGGPVATDGRVVRFPFSAPDVPWRPARFDLVTGSFSLDDLGRLDDGLLAPPSGFVPARATPFPGPAGAGAGILPAFTLTPETPLAASELVVVALHGGPIARWGGEFNAEFQLFAALGIPVVALDYPGSTGSGQAFMRSLFGRAGSVDVAAVASVVDALTEAGTPGVILYGESYGAYLALATAAVRPCTAVIAFAPFASFESLRATGTPEVREVLELLDGGNPREFGRNPDIPWRNIRSKVLIAHGTADRTIPVEHSRAVARVLRDRDAAGEDDVRLVEFEGQGHALSGRRVLEQWYREIARFVATLPGSRSPAQREHHQQQGR